MRVKLYLTFSLESDNSLYYVFVNFPCRIVENDLISFEIVENLLDDTTESIIRYYYENLKDNYISFTCKNVIFEEDKNGIYQSCDLEY